MPDAESLLNLAQDQGAVGEFLRENRGDLVPAENEPGVFWLLMSPVGRPNDRFLARLVWTSYPQAPPSVRFHDRVGGTFAVPCAWPAISGYRIGTWDICKPFTAEGYALHPEWRQGPTAWPTVGNPFLWVASVLQNDLNLSTGRAG